jgi:hypothetical protein
VLAACSTAKPTQDTTIPHPKGATDLILREEVTGGFVPPWFLATQAPFFSLYGDGTVIYRNEQATVPFDQDTIGRGLPFAIARLSEAQIQELLRFALNDGGLATAKPHYDSVGAADVPTTVFTIRAAGLNKTVSVYGLSIDPSDSAEAPARAAFLRLDARLHEFVAGLTGSTWKPDRWRGTLMKVEGDVAEAKAWPWPNLRPDDFTADPTNDFPLPHRTMTQSEVDALGLKSIEGGFNRLNIVGPDGTTMYTFGLRPLLPDERF